MQKLFNTLTNLNIMAKLFSIFIFLFALSISISAQVGIGTSTPDASAALDVTATNKGLLIPRVELASAIPSPAAGLMVHQTTAPAGFYYYNGTAWTMIGAQGPAGPTGATGATGPAGPAGQGVPTGGTADQVLAKINGDDYNTQWVTAGSGSGDDLGNHTATQNLAMGGNNITGANNLTATGTATLGGNTYPTATGTNGQVLSTDGAGTLSWGSVGGSGVVFQGFITGNVSLPAAVSITNPVVVDFSDVQFQDTTVINKTTVYTNTTAGGGGTTTAPGYIINQSGFYMITCNLSSSATNNAYPAPLIDINPGNSSTFTSIISRIYGTGQSNSIYWQTHGKTRGQLTTVYYFNAGDSFVIRGQNGLNGTVNLNTGFTSNLTVIKI